MNLRKIKIGIRNILIILFYFTGVPFLKKLSFKFRRISLIRIICFHSIENELIFEKKIVFLKNNYSIKNINDFYTNKLELKKINVIITFDDGYKNWISNALPILEKHNIPAIFFVNSIGSDKKKQELSNKDIENISKNKLFTIGSHGKNHLDISTLNDRELEAEVVEDKKNLEKVIKNKVKYYAFPYGHKKNFNLNIFNYFDNVFSIIPGFNTVADNQKLFYRDSIDPKYSNILYNAWLSGSYDIYWRIKAYIGEPIEKLWK